MKKLYIYISLVVTLGVLFSSCDDFLDTLPDRRVEITTPEQVRDLLVSAYPQNSPTFALEMASDNTDENIGNLSSISLFQTQAYQWKDITSTEGNDNLNGVWESNYMAIATANMAIEAIEKIGNLDESLNPHMGEALLCRAYSHFVLVTTFSNMYSESSNVNLGIPYMLAPEKTVKPKYDRTTVEKTYSMINEDIENGLLLIDDDFYTQPKYHFNKKAAYAFAARFNLYYRKFDKAIQYANIALGENPSSELRNWAALGATSWNSLARGNEYIDTKNRANLLLSSTDSFWPSFIRIYSSQQLKYTHNDMIDDFETTNATGPWGEPSNYYLKATRFVVPIATVLKLYPYFEIADPVSRVGYYHMVVPLFSTDETLLTRAEAKVLSGNTQLALDDINLFLKGFRSNSKTLTPTMINSFYDKISYYTPTQPTIKKKLNPDRSLIILDDTDKYAENLIHSILQLRRVLTIHEGYRWHDVNRYKIVIYRRSIDDTQSGSGRIKVADELTINDSRRAIQLPQDVIDGGLAPNPRGQK